MDVVEASKIAREHEVNFEPGKDHGVSPAIFRAAVVLADAVDSLTKQHAREMVDGGHDGSCLEAKAAAYKLCAHLEAELERAASGNATLRAELKRLTEENERKDQNAAEWMQTADEAEERARSLTEENEHYQDVVQFIHSKALTAIKAALKRAREAEQRAADNERIAEGSRERLKTLYENTSRALNKELGI